jgi:hypothetical protein
VTDSSGRWVVQFVLGVKMAPLLGGKIISFANSITRQQASSLQFCAERPPRWIVDVEASTDRMMRETESASNATREDCSSATDSGSVNVNLQQRVSGVLPVRIDVPRAGNSYHFVRPLVLDEETKVSFTYKSK